MSDRLSVLGLRASTVVGVHEWERHERQEVLVDLDVELDLAGAAASDDLADAVDYGDLTRAVKAHVEEARFHLVEALAGSVAAFVLARYEAVRALTVRVTKPRASEIAASVAVEIRRARS